MRRLKMKVYGKDGQEVAESITAANTKDGIRKAARETGFSVGLEEIAFIVWTKDNEVVRKGKHTYIKD